MRGDEGTDMSKWHDFWTRDRSVNFVGVLLTSCLVGLAGYVIANGIAALMRWAAMR